MASFHGAQSSIFYVLYFLWVCIYDLKLVASYISAWINDLSLSLSLLAEIYTFQMSDNIYLGFIEHEWVHLRNGWKSEQFRKWMPNQSAMILHRSLHFIYNFQKLPIAYIIIIYTLYCLNPLHIAHSSYESLAMPWFYQHDQLMHSPVVFIIHEFSAFCTIPLSSRYFFMPNSKMIHWVFV